MTNERFVHIHEVEGYEWILIKTIPKTYRSSSVSLTQGTTWFCVPARENVILFGSSFPSPMGLDPPQIHDFITSSPKQLFIESARTLPDVVPLGIKIRNFCYKIIYKICVPVHVLYSKYLLESTLKRLILEKDQQAWINCMNIKLSIA